MPGITVDLTGVRAKVSQQAFDRGQYNMAQTMHATMNENFVPFKDGDLRNLSNVAPDGKTIEWSAPYARKHYYTNFSPNYTTPGTGPYWDIKAKGMFMSDWIDAFTKGAGY